MFIYEHDETLSIIAHSWKIKTTVLLSFSNKKQDPQRWWTFAGSWIPSDCVAEYSFYSFLGYFAFLESCWWPESNWSASNAPWMTITVSFYLTLKIPESTVLSASHGPPATMLRMRRTVSAEKCISVCIRFSIDALQ